MNKINDRFTLGFIAGIGGNIVKTIIEQVASHTGICRETGVKKAAGIFLKRSDISTPKGKIIGFVADNMIASLLGVSCVYWYTLMGKDNYLLKGAGLGALEWTGLYGVLSRIGATSIYPLKPQNVLVGMLSHLAFGATKGAIIVTLGDERLFTPKNINQEIKQPQRLKLVGHVRRQKQQKVSIGSAK